MKIKSLLIGMLACTALVGCTNEDSPVNNENEPLKSGKAYMGVKIELSSDGMSSRAVTDGSYVSSTGEHAINTIAFAFYNADGSYYGQSFVAATDDTDQNGNDNVEAIADPVVALETKNKVFPTQVVAFVNVFESNTAAENVLKSKSLSDAYNILTEEIDGQTNQGFIMTNSTYLNESTTVMTATPVSPKNFYEKEELAKANPIDMYIERVASKVIAKTATNITITDIPTADNNVTLTFKDITFALNATNKSSHLLKNIDNSWNFGTDWITDWNMANNYRCFWAKDPNYTNGTYQEDAFDNEIDGSENDNKNTANNSLNYYKYDNGNTIPENGIYCLENTTNGMLASLNPYSYLTHVLVKGQYYNGNTMMKTFYYYGSWAYEVDAEATEGLIPDQEDFREQLATATKCFYALNGEKHSLYTIDANDVTIVRAKEQGADKVTIALKELPENVELYTKNSDNGYTKVEDLTAANEAILNYIGTATMFKEGKGYFPVLIEHFGKAEKVGQYGVVRNHVYELTINSIKNLATGLVDEDEPIIPEPKDYTYYLGATLKILSWKKVSQSVEL